MISVLESVRMGCCSQSKILSGTSPADAIQRTAMAPTDKDIRATTNAGPLRRERIMNRATTAIIDPIPVLEPTSTRAATSTPVMPTATSLRRESLARSTTYRADASPIDKMKARAF